MFKNFNISENNIIIVELAKVLRYLTKGPSCPFSRVSQFYHNCPRSIQDLLKPQASWFSTSYYNENQRKSLIPRHRFVTNCGLVLCKYLILLIMGIPVLKIFQNQRTIASKCLNKIIQITDSSRLKMGFLAKLVNCHLDILMSTWRPTRLLKTNCFWLVWHNNWPMWWWHNTLYCPSFHVYGWG